MRRDDGGMDNLDAERRILDAIRPLLRAECRSGIRPCPFGSCPHNLLVEQSRSGPRLSRRLHDPLDVMESCALDVAERRARSDEEVAELLDVPVGRVRQTEERALAKVCGL